MIIVPVEENKVGIAGLSDARFRAADYGGSGLEAVGAGLAKLGEGGQQFASARDVNRQLDSRAIDLGDRHRRNLDDAAVKRAYVAFSKAAAPLLHGDDGILNRAGADAHDVFPDVAAGFADAYDQALAPLDPEQRAAVAPALAERVRTYIALSGEHVREQGAVEQRRQSAELQQTAARDAVAHAASPDLHDHYMATGENAIRQQAWIDGVPDEERDRQIADYVSRTHADTIDALAARDPVRAAGWLARFGGAMTDQDKRVAMGVLDPALIHPAVATAMSQQLMEAGGNNDFADPVVSSAQYDELAPPNAGSVQRAGFRMMPAAMQLDTADELLSGGSSTVDPQVQASGTDDITADDVAADGVTPKIFSAPAPHNSAPADPASLPLISDAELTALQKGSVSAQQQARNRIQTRADLSDPRVTTLLRMIGHFEGTDKGGYRQVQINASTNGKKMVDFSRFPNIGLAAGRYQMEKKNMYRYGIQNLGITSYNPDDQDMMAAYVIRRFHILDKLDAGDTAGAVAQLGEHWMSIPQPGKPAGKTGTARGTYEIFMKIYNEIYPIEVENRQRRQENNSYLNMLNYIPTDALGPGIGRALNRSSQPTNVTPILNKYHLFDRNKGR